MRRFLSPHTCPDCNGARLRPEALAVTLGGVGIAGFTALPVDEALGVISHQRFLELCEADTEIGYRVFRSIAGEISNRLGKTNKDVLNLTTALSFVLTSR